MKQIAIGYNGGNGTIKATARFQNQEIYSNIVPAYQVSGTEGKQTRQKQANELLNREPNEIPEDPSTPFDKADFILDFKDRQTYHGYLALGHRQATSRTGDISRYWSEDALRNFLNIVASILVEDEAELFVFANLPVDAADDMNKKKVIACLEGDHTFTQILNGERRTCRFKVHVIGVIMEGLGAVIAFGKKGAKNGGIEGGQFTHDLIGADGMRVNIDLCMSIPAGVARIGVIMNEQLSEWKEYRGRQFSNEELHRILLAAVPMTPRPGANKYPELYHNGRQIPDQMIERFYQSAKVAAFGEIAPEIAQKWRSNMQGAVGSDFASIVYVGGAPHHFAVPMRQLLPGLIIPNRPELADVKGAAVLAERKYIRDYQHQTTQKVW